MVPVINYSFQVVLMTLDSVQGLPLIVLTNIKSSVVTTNYIDNIQKKTLTLLMANPVVDIRLS